MTGFKGEVRDRIMVRKEGVSQSCLEQNCSLDVSREVGLFHRFSGRVRRAFWSTSRVQFVNTE